MMAVSIFDQCKATFESENIRRIILIDDDFELQSLTESIRSCNSDAGEAKVLKHLGWDLERDPPENLLELVSKNWSSLGEEIHGNLAMIRVVKELENIFQGAVQIYALETSRLEVLQGELSSKPDSVDIILLDWKWHGKSFYKADNWSIMKGMLKMRINHQSPDFLVLMSADDGVSHDTVKNDVLSELAAPAGMFAVWRKLSSSEPKFWKLRLAVQLRSWVQNTKFRRVSCDFLLAVKTAQENVLETMVTSLGVDELAFIFSRATHSEGHPLGDYVRWLLEPTLSGLYKEAVQKACSKLDDLQVDILPDEIRFLDSSQPLNPELKWLFHRRIWQPASDRVSRVYLGDVFSPSEPALDSTVYVVVSAACGLISRGPKGPSPGKKEAEDEMIPVFLVAGRVRDLDVRRGKNDDLVSDFFCFGDSFASVVWNMKKFEMCDFRNLSEKILELKVTRNYRLQESEARTLQRAFFSYQGRDGRPKLVLSKPIRVKLFQWVDGPSSIDFEGEARIFQTGDKWKVQCLPSHVGEIIENLPIGRDYGGLAALLSEPLDIGKKLKCSPRDLSDKVKYTASDDRPSQPAQCDALIVFHSYAN